MITEKNVRGNGSAFRAVYVDRAPGGWHHREEVTNAAIRRFRGDAGGEMPSEFRFLVFTPRELEKALVAFAIRAQKKIPMGSVKGAEVIEGEKPSAVLTVEPDSGDSVEVPYTSEEVVGSLVGLCLDRKIPLPREHEKALEVFKGRMALRIQLSELK